MCVFTVLQLQMEGPRERNDCKTCSKSNQDISPVWGVCLMNETADSVFYSFRRTRLCSVDFPKQMFGNWEHCMSLKTSVLLQNYR